MDCSELLNEISQLPNIQRDMVVMRSSEIGNKSFDELRLLKLRQILNEQMFQKQRQAEPEVVSQQQNYFILNCITQSRIIQKDNKEEMMKKVLSHSSNGTDVIKDNVTLIREKWLKESVNIPQENVDELVMLNVLLTQLKGHLRKEVISMLHIFCGQVHHTFIQQVMRSRDDVQYTGIDTSGAVISANKRIAQTMGKEAQFHVYDVLYHGLKRKFDLVIVVNAEGFLSSKQSASLLTTISQSKSSFMLVDFELINSAVLNNLKNTEINEVHTWNLRLQPNLFDLEFPICLNILMTGKVWSLWELPLHQLTMKTNS